ncbi:MAG: hypothetical protein ACI9T7_000812 [Oleiphilaceae bacterium]
MIAGAKQAAQEVGISIYARGAIDDDDVKGQQYIINQAIYKEQCLGLLFAR